MKKQVRRLIGMTLCAALMAAVPVSAATVVGGGYMGGTGSTGSADGGSGDSTDSSYDGGAYYGGYYGGYYGETYDPYWYDKDETLSEGDKAAWHYSIHYQQIPENKGYDSEYLKQVQAQYDRIAANPNNATAQAEMTWVEIPVWRLSNGQKVSDTTRVQVLSSIAEEVKQIFTEIYNGPEQFPINSIGGYTWRSNGLDSYHSAGLAIDINPDQNPQVREDGTVIVGSKWEPGVNPYSISRDSDVVKAFGKYGWSWGAAFTTKDYMHFDF